MPLQLFVPRRVDPYRAGIMTSDPFASIVPMIQPSILSADFTKLGLEIGEVLAGGGDFLHLDILDGHFAPNLSFGPAVTAAARRSTTCFLDAHLMITDPVRYAAPLIKAGANSVTFHIEAVTDAPATARDLRKLGCRVGITLKPQTPVETIWPVLDDVDLVLVMSVEPGFSGQSFMPAVLPKAEEIKRRLRPSQRLQMDGGLKVDNIRRARNAGVDWFVVASAIFDEPHRAVAIAALRHALTK